MAANSSFAQNAGTSQRFTFCYCLDVCKSNSILSVNVDRLPCSDTPISRPKGRKAKYPKIDYGYESVDHRGLYFIGTVTHSLDLRKSAGGFIHGFRYTGQFFFNIRQTKKNCMFACQNFIACHRCDDDREAGTRSANERLGCSFSSRCTRPQQLTAFLRLVI